MKISEEVLTQQISRLNNLKDEVVMLFSSDLDYDGDTGNGQINILHTNKCMI